MPDYGTAIMVKLNDGAVVVEHADPTIGVSWDLWEQMGPPHKRDDGTLWLDTAGRYQYEPVGPELSWAGPELDVMVFRRVVERAEAPSSSTRESEIPK